MTTLLQTRPGATKPRHTRRRRQAATPRAAGLGVMTFNIGAAAPDRAAAILRWLRTRPEQILVLTETSAGAGTELIAEGLSADGFAVSRTPAPRERGVLLASRLPCGGDAPVLDVTLPCRAAGIALEIDGGALGVIGVYVPSRDRSEAKVARKHAFVSSLIETLKALPAAARERLVLAGDYNAIARGHEPPLPGFFPWEYGLHEELERIGLRSAHELRGTGAGPHPHSWIGRTGNGYLYDYIHLGGALHGSLERCRYLHGPRDRRLSDHAAVSVRLHLA